MSAASDNKAIHSGMVIDDRVRLIEELGAGGMGTVWRAQHLALGTEVAVKFIISKNRRTRGLIERFKREAQAAARIKSPHVAQTIDYGATDGTPYIVMELLKGEALGQNLARQGHPSLRFVSVVVSQTAKALHEAHRHEIIHRDIKPDNIFITHSAGEICVKLLDFGLAKVREFSAQALTKSGTAVGTPAYISREQLMNSDDVRPSADLWSLAVVAYECLTGELPFVGLTVTETCNAIRKGDYTKPSVLDDRLNTRIDEWFARALALDTNERFPDARRLATTFIRAVRSLEREFAPGSGDSWETHAYYGPSSTRRPPPSEGEGRGRTRHSRQSGEQRSTVPVPSSSSGVEFGLDGLWEDNGRHPSEAAIAASNVKIVAAPPGAAQAELAFLEASWDANTEVALVPEPKPPPAPAVRTTIASLRQRGHTVLLIVIGVGAVLVGALIAALAMVD